MPPGTWLKPVDSTTYDVQLPFEEGFSSLKDSLKDAATNFKDRLDRSFRLYVNPVHALCQACPESGRTDSRFRSAGPFRAGAGATMTQKHRKKRWSEP